MLKGLALSWGQWLVHNGGRRVSGGLKQAATDAGTVDESLGQRLPLANLFTNEIGRGTIS